MLIQESQIVNGISFDGFASSLKIFAQIWDIIPQDPAAFAKAQSEFT